jgi:hypothetical protein
VASRIDDGQLGRRAIRRRRSGRVFFPALHGTTALGHSSLFLRHGVNNFGFWLDFRVSATALRWVFIGVLYLGLTENNSTPGLPAARRHDWSMKIKIRTPQKGKDERKKSTTVTAFSCLLRHTEGRTDMFHRNRTKKKKRSDPERDRSMRENRPGKRERRGGGR